ncbi:hypothetical protein BN1723_013870, partial [Verticillium longisporum]
MIPLPSDSTSSSRSLSLSSSGTAGITELKRGYVKPNERSAKLKSYAFPKGTTAVLNEKIIKKNEIGRYVSVTEVTSTGEAMEVDS